MKNLKNNKKKKQYVISEPCSYLLFFPKALRKKNQVCSDNNKVVYSFVHCEVLLCTCAPSWRVRGTAQQSWILELKYRLKPILLLHNFTAHRLKLCKNVHWTNFSYFLLSFWSFCVNFLQFWSGNGADRAACWLNSSRSVLVRRPSGFLQVCLIKLRINTRTRMTPVVTYLSSEIH